MSSVLSWVDSGWGLLFLGIALGLVISRILPGKG